MSPRTLTTIGVFNAKATIEAWTWSLMVRTDPIDLEWAAFPHGTWNDKPTEADELGDYTGLEKPFNKLITRFAESGLRSTPTQPE